MRALSIYLHKNKSRQDLESLHGKGAAVAAVLAKIRLFRVWTFKSTIILSAKPSYGVLVWAGFLALGVFSGPHTFPIQVVCYLASLGACIWWFVVSRTHGRRELARRALGYFAFGFGSMLPLSAAYIILLGAVHKDSLIHTIVLFIACLAAAAGLIAGAFHLVFRRHENAA